MRRRQHLSDKGEGVIGDWLKKGVTWAQNNLLSDANSNKLFEGEMHVP